MVSPRESEIASVKGAGLVGPLFGDGHTELHIKVFFNDQQKGVFRNWTSEDATSFLSASFYMAALPSHSFSLELTLISPFFGPFPCNVLEKMGT